MNMKESRHQVEAAVVEFDDGGNTIWVHSPNGCTILRIKATGRIKVNEGCINPVAHSDMIVQGDINICVP